jgi:hypothetical protein
MHVLSLIISTGGLSDEQLSALKEVITLHNCGWDIDRHGSSSITQHFQTLSDAIFRLDKLLNDLRGWSTRLDVKDVTMNYVVHGIYSVSE